MLSFKGYGAIYFIKGYILPIREANIILKAAWVEKRGEQQRNERRRMLTHSVLAMNNKLKCPRCGSEDHYVEEDYELGYYVACWKCGSAVTGNYWLDSSGPYREIEE